MGEKKNSPEIRFKGFEEEWGMEKLGKLGETYSGLSGKTKVDFGHGEGKYITYMNVFSNTIANPQMTEPIEIDKSQNQVNSGDVLFTTSSETPQEVGMSTIWVGNADNIYLNSFCFGYRPNIKFDNHYLAYVLRSTSMRKKITFLAQGISRYNISKNRVMEIDIPTPLENEQTQIGTYFQNLDSLISLHQRKYDKLLTVKKAMLEKMFPKEGADVPEIRFKGFEGKWEKKTLEQGSSKIGDGLHGTPQYVDNGGVFFINGNNLTSGEVVINSETKQVTVYEQSKNDKSLDANTILMSINGTIGNLAYYKNEKIMLGKSVAYITLNNINKTFLYGYLQTACIQNHFTNNLTGSTIKNLGLKTIRETEISLPKIEEQTKIGTFFQNLDTLITQHQKELEKLKNLKKACLEKMFV
jgi:type I restriction enzyme S subunit